MPMCWMDRHGASPGSFNMVDFLRNMFHQHAETYTVVAEKSDIIREAGTAAAVERIRAVTVTNSSLLNRFDSVPFSPH
jgi:hypothetical protein